MSIYRGLITIVRDGRSWPPGSLHDFDEGDAKGLGPSRVKLEADQVAAHAAYALNSVSVPAIEVIAGDVLAGTESAGNVPGDAPPADPVPPADDQTGGASTRIADIKAAFDLLDAEKDFWKSGKRAGKPKQKPIEEIVGFDISDADIDLALALADTGV